MNFTITCTVSAVAEKRDEERNICGWEFLFFRVALWTWWIVEEVGKSEKSLLKLVNNFSCQSVATYAHHVIIQMIVYCHNVYSTQILICAQSYISGHMHERKRGVLLMISHKTQSFISEIFTFSYLSNTEKQTTGTSCVFYYLILFSYAVFLFLSVSTLFDCIINWITIFFN